MKDREKMKVAITFPPMKTEKGVPLLSQNRQFQWFNEPTYIFPVIPAYAATMLKEKGYDTLYLDGIAKEITYEQWLSRMKQFSPDIIAMETKTPVVKRTWKIIDEIKEELPDTKIVLMGDHVTAFPEESLRNSKVDYVIAGGDFDFAIVNVAEHLNNKIKLEPGVYYRKGKQIINTGHFKQQNLRDMPFIDRDLVDWEDYAYKNGNFKFTPGTYTMVGRDCWWHRCTFCSWTTTFKSFRTIDPVRAVDEVEHLVENYGVREIFDDAGTFPVGKWLEIFCNELIKRKLNDKVVMGCNMRARALNQEQYNLMGKANFRFLLYGLESANQKTLDMIDKGMTAQELIDAVRMAKKAGLEPHVTTMIGYPWETKEEAQKTIDVTKMLFDEGSVDTMQATVVIPYPGTPLYQQCKENGWLLTEDYDDFDQRSQIMKCPMTEEEVKEMTQGLYKVFFSPKYVVRKLTNIRTIEDLKFIKYGAQKVMGHLLDFKHEEKKKEYVSS